MKILVVEDDPDVASVLRRGLEAEGFEVTVADRISEALEAARANAFAAVVLDMMLPDGSGGEVCRALREEGFTAPVLFLSAKDEVRDRAEGLAAGADDYIVKPFAFDELLARLQAQLLRKGGADQPERIVAGGLTLDLATRRVIFDGLRIRLTQREAELLTMFMQAANRPLSRGEIFERLWAGQGGASLNVVDVYVGYLRGKLTEVGRRGGPVIATVRGRGFILETGRGASRNGS